MIALNALEFCLFTFGSGKVAFVLGLRLLSKRKPYRRPKYEISTAPTKAKSREPASSPALSQNKIGWKGLKIQRVSQADGCGE